MHCFHPADLSGIGLLDLWVGLAGSFLFGSSIAGGLLHAASFCRKEDYTQGAH